VAEGNEEPLHVSEARLRRLRLHLVPKEQLPTVVIHDMRRHQLILIDVARFGREMSVRRSQTLTRACRGCGLDFVFVTAFESRHEFQQLALDCPWGTFAWFADETEHIVHFDDKPGGAWAQPSE